MSEEAIRIEDVSFSFGRFEVLRNVNLSFHRNQFAVLVGPNGGGKTTLLRLILGLLKPDDGWLEVLGEEPAAVRQRLGYVPQHFQFDTHFPIRVRDVVRMGRLGRFRIPFTGKREEERAVASALDSVGMPGFEERPFARLSGGQRQRVLIARALATDPEILLLDEPTANVDPTGEKEILDLLDSLKGSRTILLVTHNLAAVSRFLETIVCVNRSAHIHPTAEQIDADLLRHIIGSEPHAECGSGAGG